MKWITQHTIALLFALAVTAVCLTGIAGAAPDTGKKPDSKLAVIESVSLSGEGDKSELVIKLSSPPVYTSYKTNAPLRLVLDLSQASQGEILEPIVINKGNFKTVTINRYDTDPGVLTRIDIELDKDLEAVISSTPDKKGELRISFPPPFAAAVAVAETATAANTEQITAKEPVAAEVKAIPAAPVNSSGKQTAITSAPVEPVQGQTAKDSTLSNPQKPRSLTAITANGNAIILAIEGGAADFKSFRLSNPERLVVDLFETTSLLPSRVVPVNVSGIALARLGLYPDKVRVVFDATNGVFPGADATKSKEGITIILKTLIAAKPDPAIARADIARAEKAAEATLHTKSRAVEPKVTAAKTPAPAMEPARQQLPESSENNSVAVLSQTVSPPPPSKPSMEKQPVKTAVELPKRSAGPATIEMIDFQVIEGISRIAVKVKGDIAVSRPVKSPGFITMTIKNAGLPKNLQRSLDTQIFSSPVLRITPVIIKAAKGTDIKIKIALRKTAPFEFRQEGDMLFVDFSNPSEIAADRLPEEFQDPRYQRAGSNKASASKEAEIHSELGQPEQVMKAADSTAKYKGRKVTLEFADAEVRKIFQLLSEISNKNFVLGDDVIGTISIKLVNVPWDQALDIILDTKGLDKREDGNIIIIKAKGKFKSDTEMEQESKKVLTRSLEMKTEMFSINYATLADIKNQFEKLKQHEKAAISDDVRTNKLIVRDVPQAIEEMRKLKEQLDVPEKQVMIEARIVEATSTFTRSLGVNWGMHFRDGSASFFGINSLDTGFGGLTSAAPTSGTGSSAGGAMGISFGTLTSNIQLDMRLNAAASAGLIKIVSSPKVATINNKTAKISQGQQIPYQNTTATTGAVTAFVAATLSLEVTPHINANGTIGMKIDAKNDAPGAGSPPPINTKSATTELLLRDGETTVIGGIYVDSDTESDDGVPFLMDIPFLGKLFKSNTKQKTKSELLIFITPRIIGMI